MQEIQESSPEPHLRILSITVVTCEMSTIVQQFDHSLALSFFGIGIKIDLFQSGVTGLETMKKKKSS